MNLYIPASDISTVSFRQKVSSQDASFNYTTSTTTLASAVEADIQPLAARLVEDQTGGSYRITHRMFSPADSSVVSLLPSSVIQVVDASRTYQLRGVKNYDSHMESDLEELT